MKPTQQTKRTNGRTEQAVQEPPPPLEQMPHGQQDLAVRHAAVEVVDESESTPVKMPEIDAATRGEIDMQIATARRFPRDPARAIRAALKLATYNEEIAEGCFYVLPRGGKKIDGPSIRLAEIIASCWGNIRYGAEVCEEGQRFIRSRGFCWDLESNTAYAGVVQRRITNKKGERYDDDMIGVTGNAANSIAVRNAVNRVVPRVYTDMILREVKRVAVGDASTFAARRDRVIERYGKMGVTVEQVLAATGKESVEALTLEDLELLIGVGTAIREGQTSIDAVFGGPAGEGEPQPTTGVAGLKNILSRVQHAKATAAAAPPKDPAAAPVAAPPAPAAAPAPAGAPDEQEQEEIRAREAAEAGKR